MHALFGWFSRCHDDVYRGAVGDHAALLAEFSVGSPSVSEGFGGAGADFNLYPLLWCRCTPVARLTVHPAVFSDDDWMCRIFHEDHISTRCHRRWTVDSE